MTSKKSTVKKSPAHKYIAAYYNDWGRRTTMDGARKQGATISKKNGGDMVYINEDYPGNPVGVVYPDGDKWVWEPRFRGRSRYFDPKTGKLKGYY